MNSRAMRVLLLFLGLALIAIGQHSLLGLPPANSAKSALPNLLFGLLNWVAGGLSGWLATAMGASMIAWSLLLRVLAQHAARKRGE